MTGYIAWGGGAALVTWFSHQRDGFSNLRNVSTFVSTQSAQNEYWSSAFFRLSHPFLNACLLCQLLLCMSLFNFATIFNNRIHISCDAFKNSLGQAGRSAHPKGDLVVVICSLLTAGSG
ncbi:6-bisphosphatase class,Fructose-1 [Trichinella pseudospiralis]